MAAKALRTERMRSDKETREEALASKVSRGGLLNKFAPWRIRHRKGQAEMAQG
jgi:hypothetical protein